MSFLTFLGLVILAAAMIYVLRVGPNRHWRRGDRLQRDWQHERQQIMDSLQSIQAQQEAEAGRPAAAPPARDDQADPR